MKTLARNLVLAIDSALRPYASYLPFVAAIVTFGAWWFSTTIQERVTRLKTQVETILREDELAQTIAFMQNDLRNLDKRGMRIESRISSGEPELKTLSEEQRNLYRSFHYAGEEQMWSDVWAGDIFATHLEIDRTTKYLGLLGAPSCGGEPPGPAAESGELQTCLEHVRQEPFSMQAVIVSLSKLNLPPYRPHCLRDRIHYLERQFARISLAFSDTQQPLRDLQESLGPTSIEPPDFKAMATLLPAMNQTSEIVRKCILKPHEKVMRAINLDRQELLHWARTDLLSARQRQATLVNAIAAMLYVLSAFLGIYGKWVEATEKAEKESQRRDTTNQAHP